MYNYLLPSQRDRSECEKNWLCLFNAIIISVQSWTNWEVEAYG